MARTKKKGRRKTKQAPAAVPMVTEGPLAAPRVYRPGVDAMEADEEMQYDPSAYSAIHAFNLGWPCLSFDILRDTLGALRDQFPHTMFLVAGTQADKASNNNVAVVKLTNITGKNRVDAGGSDSDSESDSDASDGEQSLEPLKGPSFQERSIPHHGCVNRIRAMQQKPHIVAIWGDSGHVQIWDISTQLNSLASGEAATSERSRQNLLQSFKHKDEGFALDWSPFAEGTLATGDWKSAIHIWHPTSGAKWNVDNSPYLGHTASVEDLQWSPTEANVLASCSVDKTIAIWDTRSRSQACSLRAHGTDVNVISWNRLASCMLASGSDDGEFRVWDLRSFKEDSIVAHSKYHTAAITSIEWNPHDSSQLAASSEDNQLSIWDLSLERDADEEAQYQASLGKQQAEAPADLPAQLFFVHQGQKNMKELHWHGQIRSFIVSTALDGFNAFRPSNCDMVI